MISSKSARHIKRNGEISVLEKKAEPRVLEVAVESGVQTIRIALG